MRLLIITHSYSPEQTPRALRWSAIAERWAAKGHEVDVISFRGKNQPAQDRLSGVSVHRVGGWGPENLRHRAAGFDNSRPRKFRSKMKRAVRWFYDHTWKQVWWPDYAGPWYFNAVRKARNLITGRKHDILITSSLPFTAHIVGLNIKRQFQTLPWLVDIGDPFYFLNRTPANNHTIYRRLNFNVERKVLERADAISVTNGATKDIYSGLFPESADRIRVIYPLLRDDAVVQPQRRIFAEDDHIRLLFVGSLYRQIRSPKHVLHAFSRLLQTELGKRLELHFFGRINDCQCEFEPYQQLVGKKVFMHGEVNNVTARQAMVEASFLVNIGNDTSYQLPSKVVEYGNSGKPILNFATLAADSSAAILRTHPAAYTAWFGPGTDQGGDQFTELVTFIDQPRSIQRDLLEEWCKPFQVETIVREYELLIREAHVRLQRRTRGFNLEGVGETLRVV